MFIKHRGYNCPCLAILTPSAQDESSDLHITRCELQINLMIPAHHLLKGFQKYFMPMRLASVQNYQVLANMWEERTCIILKSITFIYVCVHSCNIYTVTKKAGEAVAEVTGSCEPPDTGVGNRTQILSTRTLNC